MNNMIYALLNALAVAATIAINGLANALPLNGQNTGEISNRYPLLITPAGWAFSIWGLIYLLQIGFAVYGFLPSIRTNAAFQKLSPFFLLSAAANISWIFFWHYQKFPLSLVAMLVILGSLIAVYLILNVGKVQRELADRLLLEAPFRVYLGWITVASIVNVSLLLFQSGWNGFGIRPEIWTVLLLGTALILGIVAIVTRKDWLFTAVLAWAIFAIALKPQQHDLVKIGSFISAGSLLVLTLVGFVLR
ncbi:MAG: tryptophan-rich sensory protein, partial [Spirochaetia bacterium]|nr:tryptophan-rich sensory protein [Spirochaetia bacterium]